MERELLFGDRAAFRRWLEENGRTSEGVWLVFGKAGGPQTVKAGEALEEALCFGWIDGQMQRIDEGRYRKYFAPRRPGSNWSAKNRALAERLLREGRMDGRGREEVERARADGRWAAPAPPAITAEQMDALEELLRGREPAHGNFLGMSPSVRRTYARGYYAAKTEAGRAKRLAWMVERLNKNLKPM